MSRQHFAVIAGELSLKAAQVEATAALLAGGATVPFIARYRKEATGTLDEVAVGAIQDRLQRLAEFDKRRAAILSSLEERSLLTADLKVTIEGADTLSRLEDLYLPHRPKRRSRATQAREKGLEPLAKLIFAQGGVDPRKEAASFVDPEKGVATGEEALAGARDIMAEWMNEDQRARSLMRKLYARKGVVRSRVVKGREEEGTKFRDYFSWEEPVRSVPSHRILAIRRGEKEGVLSFRVDPPEEEAMGILFSLFLKGRGPASAEVRIAAEDCFSRLLSSSMETEARLAMKERAEGEAIRIFAANLRELLLAPPLGSKRILAVDPGFRTGCKVVCLDGQGALLHSDTVFPHTGAGRREEAADKVRNLCRRFRIEAVAVGNGTAGRETEAFIRALGLPPEVRVVMVNESGASVYSASAAAREEFPDKDLTVRGAVSIGRRLMDPLAELVKIEPRSIGVGQYQHDVDQGGLKKSLEEVVVSCVNQVGVELNTASTQLLSFVSGLGPQLARNIVSWRDEHGRFPTRKSLMKVPRLGPKAFEQAAGFLRIHGAENPLDDSAVHPESYRVVKRMAADLKCAVADLIVDESLGRQIVLDRYVDDRCGLPTLTDIMGELARPGRDPRESFEFFSFAEGIEKPEDLTPGMKLPGIVTNVTAFGAFVDVGVHQDGLVHVSQLADRFVKDPAAVVKVQQQVTVTVLEVDLARRRIALSMKSGKKKLTS